MLRDQYREVVTKFEADAYFAIRASSDNAFLILKNPPNAFS